MNLIKLFKKATVKKIDNVDLAEQLFNTLLVSASFGNSVLDKDVEYLLSQCKTRQEILDKIIELCGEPNTPKQRYLLAKAHAWSKVSHRKLAIKYLELYLNNDLYENNYKEHHHSLGDKYFSIEEEKNIHIAEICNYLGKAYEGEYEFDKALMYYKKELELTPFWPAAYCHVGGILIKQNKLIEAMDFYLRAKKSPYYKPVKYKDFFGKTQTDSTFKKVIDDHLADLKEKIDKGYVYKPRKKATAKHGDDN